MSTREADVDADASAEGVDAAPTPDAGEEASDAGVTDAASTVDADLGVGFADASIAPPVEEPRPVDGQAGFWFGLRGGYALPYGQTAAVSLSDIVTGSIHFGIEAGYGVLPQLYVGGYFDYGIGVVQLGQGATCPDDPTVAGCNASQFRFGAVADWYFRPNALIDPWVGFGVGYDVLNVTATGTDGTTAFSSALHGFEALLRAGADLRPARSYALGAYVEGSLGHYDSSYGTPTFHGWFNIGLRVRSRL